MILHIKYGTKDRRSGGGQNLLINFVEIVPMSGKGITIDL